MNLHAICYYRSNGGGWTDGWRNEDYISRNVVKAVKQKPFNGFSRITIAGQNFRIEDTPAGQAAALEAVALGIASRIHEAGYEQVAVVPVPASDHVDPHCVFTGRRIAEEIQRVQPAFTARPVLYFDQVMEAAASGGTRNAFQIQRHLRWEGQPITQDHVVLLDDVCTTGGHLRGAKLFLANHGHYVEDAFVIARTAWERPPSMLNFAPEVL